MPGGTLCLEVTDPSGSPLPVAELGAYGGDEDRPASLRSVSWLEERTNPERLCSRPLAPGPYRVLASSPFFVPTWWPGEEDAALARPVTVEAGRRVELGTLIAVPAGTVLVTLGDGVGSGEPPIDPQTPIRFELCPATATDEPETAPRCDAETHDASEPEPPAWSAHPAERTTPWRSERRVRSLGRVPAGHWWLRACLGEIPCDPAETPVYRTRTTIDVEPGERVETTALSSPR